jgi:hypothetical protein
MTAPEVCLGTSDVGKMLNVQGATVRLWCRKYRDTPLFPAPDTYIGLDPRNRYSGWKPRRRQEIRDWYRPPGSESNPVPPAWFSLTGVISAQPLLPLLTTVDERGVDHNNLDAVRQVWNELTIHTAGECVPECLECKRALIILPEPIEPEIYFGSWNIAGMFGVQQETITTWRRRFRNTDHPFPAPRVWIGSIPGWHQTQKTGIREWKKGCTGQHRGRETAPANAGAKASRRAASAASCN